MKHGRGTTERSKKLEFCFSSQLHSLPQGFHPGLTLAPDSVRAAVSLWLLRAGSALFPQPASLGGNSSSCTGALSDLLAFTGLLATGCRTQAASPVGHPGRSPACGAHLSARLSRTPQVARGGEEPRPAPRGHSRRLPGAGAWSPGRERSEAPGASLPATTAQVSRASSAGRLRAEPAEQALGGARGCGEHCETPRGATGTLRAARGARLPTSGNGRTERAPRGAAWVSPVTPGLEATAEAGAPTARPSASQLPPFPLRRFSPALLGA